ncbi:MAG: glycosyltransferase family 4 protein, partial [Ignavibacteriaceae bacterium]
MSTGGTSRYTTNLIQSLKDFEELDFDFINLQSYYELPGKYMKRLNLIRKFPKEIDFSKYDLVHFLELDYSIYGTLRHLRKRNQRVKVIKTSHGYAKKEEIYSGIIGRLVLKPITSYIQKHVQRNVDAVIYVSDDQREFFINEYNLDRDKTYVVYLASSFSTYNGDIQNLIKKKDKMILFVGRVERRKRIEMLFEVANLMSDWKFKVIGHINDDAYYSKLQEMKPENVQFLVDVGDDELLTTYQKAKYFVSFSKWENCPVTYLESISQGT